MTEHPDEYVDASIMAELFVGELPRWYTGVCAVHYYEDDRDFVVTGENEHEIFRRSIERYTDTESGTIDLDYLAESVNEVITAEMDAL